jgi:hypothetical protein
VSLIRDGHCIQFEERSHTTKADGNGADCPLGQTSGVPQEEDVGLHGRVLVPIGGVSSSCNVAGWVIP